MALGLGLFAVAMILAVGMGWIAATNSRNFDESKHENLVALSLNGNGNGKKKA
ncbi:MAG: hypothetical protein ACOY94_19815 [Bacillota bacterium]